jgi:hypothetical protein
MRIAFWVVFGGINEEEFVVAIEKMKITKLVR